MNVMHITEEEKDEALIMLLEAGSYRGATVLHYSDMLAARLRICGTGDTQTFRLLHVGKTLGCISHEGGDERYSVVWGVVLQEARNRGLLIIKS